MTSALARTSAYTSSASRTASAGQTGWLPARAPAIAWNADGQLPRIELGPNGLPRARAVLAVTARPGVESAALGGLLYAFGLQGARLAVLSITRGEASPLNATHARLAAVRPWELQLASWLLGVSSVAVADFPDGELHSCRMPDLTERVQRAIAEHAPDLILVLDPAAGNSGDAQVARAACLAAGPAGVPVAARTIAGASGSWLVELGAETDVVREVQRSAARAHASQSEALPEVLRSLDGGSGRERLRWLVPAAIRPLAPRAAEPSLT